MAMTSAADLKFLQDWDGRFGAAYGLSPTGASLVRPDGIVGWRTENAAEDPAGTLETALRALLFRA
jgi:hypothetical protein